MGKARIMVVLVGLALFPHCFTTTKQVQVTDFKNGKVYLGKHRYYNVGDLPVGWVRKKTRLPGIHFYQPQSKATLITDAFCENVTYDTKPAALAMQRLGGLPKLKILKQSFLDVPSPKTVRTWATTEMSGQTVYFDLVVMQQQECEFEFLVILPKPEMPEVTKDFEHFVGGFHF